MAMQRSGVPKDMEGKKTRKQRKLDDIMSQIRGGRKPKKPKKPEEKLPKKGSWW